VISLYEAFTENEEQKQEAWQSFCQSNLLPACSAHCQNCPFSRGP